MTRKSFILLLVAVILIVSVTLPTSSAVPAVEVLQGEYSGESQTVYVTWQSPIPPLDGEFPLNVSAGVVVNGKTYVSSDVFDVLSIPTSARTGGIAIRVFGETGVYYPLREIAEQFGYVMLWAPRSEQNGKVLKYWVFIAKQEPNAEWLRVVSHDIPDYMYKEYIYVYTTFTPNNGWYIDWEIEQFYIPPSKK